MKKIFILFLIVSAFSACTLDRYPFDSFTPEQVLADKEGASVILLTGCYSELKNWSDQMHRIGEYSGDNMMLRGASTDGFYSFISYSHVPANDRITSFWNSSYKIINQSTDLIKMMSEGETPEIDQRLGEAYYLRGLMYFYLCRVFGRPYYQSPGTNLGVPIVNDGVPKEIFNIQLPDRATVEVTYEQAIMDLEKAESLMTLRSTAAYASAEAAQAMLSRIYLYMSGTYENPNTAYADLSILYATRVIESTHYDLLDRANFMKYNLLSPDASNQTETIFAVKRVSSEYSGYDHYYGIGGLYANIQGMGWGEMFASAEYLDLLRKAGGKNDARWAFIDPQYQISKTGDKIPAFRFIADAYNTTTGLHTGYTYVQHPLKGTEGTLYITIDKDYPLTLVDAVEKLYSIEYKNKTYIGEVDFMMTESGGNPMYYITKCSLQDNESHLHSPIISRLAELYLNRAEAYAKKGLYAEALTNLNIVRGRSIVGGEYLSLDATNAAQLIDEERQLELAFEAHRGYDVFRNGQTMTRHYPGPHPATIDIPATSKSVVHFIPQRDIDAYFGNLTQNPTYSTINESL